MDRRVRRENPDRNPKESILEAAIAEFSRFGLHGARIDRIADRAGANKRMIYYYFGSKNELYNFLLSHVYQGIVSALKDSLSGVPVVDPVEGIRLLWEGYFNYLSAHPEYVAFISWENLQQGKHAEDAQVQRVTHPLVDQVRQMLEENNLLSPEIDSRHYIVTLLGMGFFYFSNRYTLSMILGPEIYGKEQEQSFVQSMRKIIGLPLLASRSEPKP
jgi:TetR/AcrR family transcriptional regulator, upper aerobic nicotinate degradation pathway regulator